MMAFCETRYAFHQYYSTIEEKRKEWIPAKGAVEKGIDFNVTRNAFMKKT
jgi:hypothetical protein